MTIIGRVVKTGYSPNFVCSDSSDDLNHDGEENMNISTDTEDDLLYVLA